MYAIICINSCHGFRDTAKVLKRMHFFHPSPSQSMAGIDIFSFSLYQHSIARVNGSYSVFIICIRARQKTRCSWYGAVFVTHAAFGEACTMRNKYSPSGRRHNDMNANEQKENTVCEVGGGARAQADVAIGRVTRTDVSLCDHMRQSRADDAAPGWWRAAFWRQWPEMRYAARPIETFQWLSLPDGSFIRHARSSEKQNEPQWIWRCIR